MTCPKCGIVDSIFVEPRYFMGEVVAVELCECGQPAYSDEEIDTVVEVTLRLVPYEPLPQSPEPNLAMKGLILAGITAAFLLLSCLVLT